MQASYPVRIVDEVTHRVPAGKIRVNHERSEESGLDGEGNGGVAKRTSIVC